MTFRNAWIALGLMMLCAGCPATETPAPPEDAAVQDVTQTDTKTPDAAAPAVAVDVSDATQAEDIAPLSLDTVVPGPEDTEVPPEVTRLDDFAESVRAELDVPAVAVAAFDTSKFLARGVAGVRKIGEDVPITDGDRWHLGSCTKAMTATIVARLVERGEMSFDDTLATLFPDLKMHQGYLDVTVVQLLRHEGGTYGKIGQEAPDLWVSLWAAGPENIAATRRTFAEAVLQKPPQYTVGTYKYSNTGYIIVGSIIESVTGKSWEEVIEEEVFTPLGMTNCGFGAPATPGTIDAPWGHQKKSNGATIAIDPGSAQSDNPPAFGPAGTVHCDLDSWVKYLQGHLGGGPQDYLNPETFVALHTPNPPKKYALGWLVPDTAILTHMGSNNMNVVTTWLYKELNLGLIIVTNVGPASEVALPLDAKVLSLIDEVTGSNR